MKESPSGLLHGHHVENFRNCTVCHHSEVTDDEDGISSMREGDIEVTLIVEEANMSVPIRVRQ